MSTTTDVIALYTKYLNRTPSASDPGVVYWVNEIDSGRSTLSQVEINIKGSNEYKTIQIYQKYLHRFPDQPGLDYWLALLTPTGTTSISQLDASIAASDEAYVVSTYNSLLGRDPTESERVTWRTNLSSGQPRTNLNAALTGSDDVLTAQLKQVYQNLYGRDIDAEGLAYWLDRLKNKTTTISEIQKVILESEEYKKKVTTGTTPTIKVDPNNLESSLKAAYKQLFGVPLENSDLTFFLKATSGTSVYSGKGTIMADDTGVNYDIALAPAFGATATGTTVAIAMSNAGTPYAYTDKIANSSDWAVFQVFNGTSTNLTLILSVVNGTATVNTSQTLKQFIGGEAGSWVNMTNNALNLPVVNGTATVNTSQTLKQFIGGEAGSWVNMTNNALNLPAGQRGYIAVNIDGGYSLKGVDYWIQQFNSGAVTAENIQATWMALPEYQVTLTYKSLLNRFPDEAGFRYWTAGLTSANLAGRISELTAAIKSGSEYKTSLGQKPATAVTSTSSSQTIELETKETRAYVFTYVTAWGEESAPSDPVIVELYPGTQTVDLTMAAPPTGNFNLQTRRIYRSVTSTVGTNYYFVTEIPIAQQTFTDDVDGTDLAETLPSLNWAEPPADLKGLIAMPNGFLAGFTGRDIYFSEAYHLHAWPVEYMQSVDYPVVGLGQFGQSLVVLTTGSPYLITGTDPSAMTLEKLDFEQACVSARSISRLGSGVAWASPDGLAYVGPDGMNVITDGLFTRKEWQALNPSSIIGAQHDNRYYGYYDNGAKAGFVFDSKSPLSPFTFIDQHYSGLFNDLRNDALYGIYQGTIKKIEGSTTPLTYTWRSKKFSMPNPINLSAWQVIASDYTNLTAKFYMDGTLIHTATVTSDAVRRLPAGVRGRNFEIELTGTSTVVAVHVSDRVEELRNV